MNGWVYDPIKRDLANTPGGINHLELCGEFIEFNVRYWPTADVANF